MGAASSSVAPSSAPIPAVGAMIDAMPTGRFHALHLLRQILLNACFAYVLEINPYIYPGMSVEFGINATKETLFASAFAFGGIFGAGVSSLQDTFGRRRVISFATGFSLALAAALIPLPQFYAICTVRFFLGVAFLTMQYSFSTWFTEFLPTFNRGPLYAALTAGYPVGRALVIGASSVIPNEAWRVHFALSAGALTIAFLISAIIGESPRYLAVIGHHAEARRRVHSIYRFNGTPLPYDSSVAAQLTWGHEGTGEVGTGETTSKETSPLVGKAKGGGSTDAKPAVPASARVAAQAASTDFFARVGALCANPPPSLGFAIVLFMGLSIQQQLIGNFGPRVFQRLIYPSDAVSVEDTHSAFPIPALLLFNFADWLGILFSVMLIDRLGRRGFFTVGFSTAAVLWIALGLIGHYFDVTGYATPQSDPDRHALQHTVLLVVTALASATRGFAPEAANLWVLETFATDQRATCYAAVNMCYQITASIAVPFGGWMVDHTGYEPTPLLIGYGTVQLVLGAFTCFLPNETVNKALKDISSGGSAAEESAPLKPPLREDAKEAAAGAESVLR